MLDGGTEDDGKQGVAQGGDGAHRADDGVEETGKEGATEGGCVRAGRRCGCQRQADHRDAPDQHQRVDEVDGHHQHADLRGVLRNQSKLDEDGAEQCFDDKEDGCADSPGAGPMAAGREAKDGYGKA